MISIIKMDRKKIKETAFYLVGGAYFFVCFFFVFTCYAHAYIDPSAVTYMIQAVAAVAIAAGAMFTVFRHKIGSFFNKGKGRKNRRRIHLTKPLEDGTADGDLYP